MTTLVQHAATGHCPASALPTSRRTSCCAPGCEVLSSSCTLPYKHKYSVPFSPVTRYFMAVPADLHPITTKVACEAELCRSPRPRSKFTSRLYRVLACIASHLLACTLLRDRCPLAWYWYLSRCFLRPAHSTSNVAVRTRAYCPHFTVNQHKPVQAKGL